MAGTALFGGSGGGSGGSGAHVMPMLVHTARDATVVNLCFVVAALLCSFGLPRRLAGASASSRERES